MRNFYIFLFAIISLSLGIWNQGMVQDLETNPTLTHPARLVSCYETTVGKKSHKRLSNACLYRMGEDYQELHYSDKTLWEKRKLEVGDNVEVTVWDHRPRNIRVTGIIATIFFMAAIVLLFLPLAKKEEESYLPE